MRASSDDLPAFGSPTSPTSASSLSRSVDPALLARQPALGEARRLARRAGEALVAAPADAAARDDDLAGRARRGRSACRPSASTCVPGGTRDDERLAVARRGAGRPRRGRRARPGSARGGGRPAGRAASRRSTSTTSPPRPPSPPSGPPLGTWASRRNDRQPLPPRAGAARRSWRGRASIRRETTRSPMPSDDPSSSSPARRPASAPPPPATPPRPATALVLAARSRGQARRRSPRSSAAPTARSRCAAT